jgi:YVTN family beta-propeller protein
VGVKFQQPLALLHIALPAREVFGMPSIHKKHLGSTLLQDVVQGNPPGRRWRIKGSSMLTIVRRSNVVCGCPAPRFHEGSLFCEAIEGISLTNCTSPYSPYSLRFGSCFQPQRMGPPGGDWDESVISVGPGAEGFDVSPDGRELWTANAQDGTVSVIDLESKKVAATLPANVQTANRLKFTPDGKLVFVSALRSPTLAVLDARTRKEFKRIAIGHGPPGPRCSPMVPASSLLPHQIVTLP